MSTQAPSKVATAERPTSPSRPRSRVAVVAVSLAGAVIGVLAGAVLWLGGTSTDGAAVEVELTRGQHADIARLQGQADRHLEQARERAQAADAARWQGLAELYEQARKARADAAATARWQGLSDRHAER